MNCFKSKYDLLLEIKCLNNQVLRLNSEIKNLKNKHTWEETLVQRLAESDLWMEELKKKHESELKKIKEQALDDKIKYIQKIHQLVFLLNDKVTKCT
jgi:ElaB/YqjD/DUF883 family membrane-anchored ribosome-binding protein